METEKKAPTQREGFLFSEFFRFYNDFDERFEGWQRRRQFFRTNFRHLLEYASPLRKTANNTHITNCQNKRQVVVALVKGHKTFGTVALHSKVKIIKQKTFERRNICCKFHFTTPTKPTKTHKEKIYRKKDALTSICLFEMQGKCGKIGKYLRQQDSRTAQRFSADRLSRFLDEVIKVVLQTVYFEQNGALLFQN